LRLLSFQKGAKKKAGLISCEWSIRKTLEETLDTFEPPSKGKLRLGGFALKFKKVYNSSWKPP